MYKRQVMAFIKSIINGIMNVIHRFTKRLVFVSFALASSKRSSSCLSLIHISRPVLNGKKNIEDITKLMKEREERYHMAADILISTDGKSLSQICEAVSYTHLLNT